MTEFRSSVNELTRRVVVYEARITLEGSAKEI